MALNQKKPIKVPSGLVLVVFCLISIALLTVWVREGATGPLHTVRSGVGVLVAPLEEFGAFLGTPLRAASNAANNMTAEPQTLEELQAQNEELLAAAIRLEEYRQENERLSQLLELRDVYGLESVGARIISRSADTWNQMITINKGSVAGLSVGMPVMSPNGLLGQIESVSPYSSTVRLITDERSGVACFLQASRAEGLVTGSVEGLLYLEFVGLDVEVRPGDAIITSGAGGVYPKGIPIGEVASVDFLSSDVAQTIIVRPLTRVATFEEVLVLTGNESEIHPNPAAAQGAASDEGAAASDTSGAGEGAEGSEGAEGARETEAAAGSNGAGN
ncbi:MAG: rod shape-determining protein MreC [Coriobacteriales bacterium]|jgi:rod shape-determining protein MreC|nr:rod shape-determining protein MreC [Coriobacteriales bacterium]